MYKLIQSNHFLSKMHMLFIIVEGTQHHVKQIFFNHLFLKNQFYYFCMYARTACKNTRWTPCNCCQSKAKCHVLNDGIQKISAIQYLTILFIFRKFKCLLILVYCIMNSSSIILKGRSLHYLLSAHVRDISIPLYA